METLIKKEAQQLMDKLHLVNFATTWSHSGRQRHLNESAKKFGIESIFSYSEEDIDANFIAARPKHFACQRLYAYSVWRPYIIKKALQSIPEGDIVFYSDADVEILQPIDFFPLRAKIEGFVSFWVNGCGEKTWTKRDLLIAMDCDKPEYTETDQIWSAYFFFENNAKNRQLIDDWQKYADDFHLVSDEPSIEPNYPEFEENRHDQSILSLLIKKAGYSPFRDWGDFGVLENPQEFATRSPVYRRCLEKSEYGHIVRFTNHLGLN